MAHAMTGAEMKTISNVFANTNFKEKIFIIGTQVDALNKPQQEWEEQKVEWIKYLSQEYNFGKVSLAESNIIPTASYLENLCREYCSLSEDDVWNLKSLAMKYRVELNNNNVEQLRSNSNIDNLKNTIKVKILSKYKEYILKDIDDEFNSIKNDLKIFFSSINKSNSKLLDALNSNSKTIKEEYEQAVKEKEELQEIIEGIEEFISQFKEDNAHRLNDLESSINSLI
jgi:methyl-accepting chemotaxis protein